MSFMSEKDGKHSVAFRVSEAEWSRLKALSAQLNKSVPRLAREALFKEASILDERRSMKSKSK